MSDGHTVGIWIGPDDDIVERFDDALGAPANYSRSERIKEAMELYLAIEDAVDAVGYDFDAEQMKRHWVRQAVLDQARDEADFD